MPNTNGNNIPPRNHSAPRKTTVATVQYFTCSLTGSAIFTSVFVLGGYFAYRGVCFKGQRFLCGGP